MDYNTTSYNYDYTNSDIGAAAAIIAVFIALIFIVISYAIVAFLLGRIFKKAGVPQWVAWVPIYNNWKLLELGNQSGVWAILAFIPFVNIVSLIFTYIAMYHIGLKLGKAGWFVLLAIFLPLIWMIWLGFDDSKWPKPKSTKKKSATKKSS